MPASAGAATSFGWVCGSSATQARTDVRRYSAIPPSLSSPGNEPLAQCMSSPARQARHSPQVGVGCRITVAPAPRVVAAEGAAGRPRPGGGCGMRDRGAAARRVGARRAALLSPAGVLVADRVRQPHARPLGPLPFNDVQVGTAPPGPADLHDDVEWTL